MSFRDFLHNVYTQLKSVKESARSRFLRSLFPNYMWGREYASDKDLQSLVRAYRTWVYIYASKNANTVASIPKSLYVAKKSANTKLLQPTRAISKDKKEYFREQVGLYHYFKKAADVEEVLDHPYLTLMKNVNPYMNSFDLGEWTQLYQELCGLAYWYAVPDTNSIPAELYIAPSQNMWKRVGSENIIEKYIYKVGTSYTEFTPDEICMFKMVNPSNPYLSGFSPLMAVLDAYNVTTNIQKYENQMFSNYGMPIGLLSTEQPITDEAEKKRVKQEWHDNYGEAGKIALLGRGVKFDAISLPPRELGFLQGRKLSQDEIAEAYGQPEAMRKATSMADKKAAEKAYKKDTILPRLMRNQEKENEWLMPKYGDPSLFVAYENPVPEDQEFEMLRRRSDVEAGLTSINEERSILGKEPVDGGDEPLVTQGRIPLSMAGMAAFTSGETGNANVRQIADQITKMLLSGEVKS